MNTNSMRDTISAINQIMEAGEDEHDYGDPVRLCKRRRYI